MAKIENKDIIEALKEKTILEVKELVDMMKEELVFLLLQLLLLLQLRLKRTMQEVELRL